MDLDDLDPRAATPTAPRPLDPLSVEELTAYIVRLEGEILRARQAIAAKEKVRAGAEALFKK
jgi:uncharacterized small protein (DUF1192 family)